MKSILRLSACFLIISFSQCSKKDTLTGIASINSDNNKAVGASANDLLGAGNYQSVKIEIQYMPGFQPDAGMISNLSTYLSGLINKPGGISIVQSAIPSANKTILTLNDIAEIEKNNRTVYTNGTQLGVYFLYTDGNYSDGNVLGLAFRNTSICILGKTIHDNSGSIGQASRTKLESTVTEHEFGHILGLVDLGSSMQTAHKDAAHGNHCSNSNCLMYYSSETTDVLGFLITGNIPQLDANCKADLHANGGK
ncbi:MAG: M12 family metallo-peptidase [Ferruginibacter sp.]